MKCSTHILELINNITTSLMQVYPDKLLCTQYAWWTVETITNTSEAQLIAQDTLILTHEQQKTIDKWITCMVDEHMPIQYLIGSVPFIDLTLQVKPPVLIPRPETEEWVSDLIALLKPIQEKSLTILDLCSGSGCIALALGKAFRHATVIGADIDEQALILSRTNAQLNNITNVTFVASDLYNHLPPTKRYDLIVSNPPYISDEAWHSLDASVSTWESYHALVAGDDGLAIIKRIIHDAYRFLRPDILRPYRLPNLYIEIGYDQGMAVAQLMEHANIADIKIHKDLSGKDRLVSGSVIHVATADSK